MLLNPWPPLFYGNVKIRQRICTFTPLREPKTCATHKMGILKYFIMPCRHFKPKKVKLSQPCDLQWIFSICVSIWNMEFFTSLWKTWPTSKRKILFWIPNSSPGPCGVIPRPNFPKLPKASLIWMQMQVHYAKILKLPPKTPNIYMTKILTYRDALY